MIKFGWIGGHSDASSGAPQPFIPHKFEVSVIADAVGTLNSRQHEYGIHFAFDVDSRSLGQSCFTAHHPRCRETIVKESPLEARYVLSRF